MVESEGMQYSSIISEDHATTPAIITMDEFEFAFGRGAATSDVDGRREG
jgi:hypothetical protein